ncbi:MAG TPA: hypothetical protein VN364_09875 [Bellilinea sp.]|nr:hypothetical protein [Bellilinea sp.]
MDDDYLEREEGQRQPPWFLLTGVIVGLLIGLLISLLVIPVKYKDTAPVALSAADKANFRLLIAQAYRANPDLPRANSRIALLQDPAIVDSLAAQAQQGLSNGEEQAARDLAGLAAAISTYAVVKVESPDPTPSESGTPAAVHTSTITPAPGPYLIVDRQPVCDAASSGLLQIELRDQDGFPAPGVQINVTWDGGVDTFFTGLKPAISTGYADFQMTPGVSYNLQVGEGGETLNAISAPECTDANGAVFAGGLKLVFGQ